jgi:hypothetical protein
MFRPETSTVDPIATGPPLPSINDTLVKTNVVELLFVSAPIAHPEDAAKAAQTITHRLTEIMFVILTIS